MSTEFEIGSLASLYPWSAADLEYPPFESATRLEGRVDRVLSTAGDRNDPVSLPALADPAADFEDAVVARRRADVDEKQRRIVAYLDRIDRDALILRRADSLAWFTAGGDLGRSLSSDGGAVAIYVDRKCRVVLADNVQSARVFEEELAGLGFQLKERPWHHDPALLFRQMTQGRRVSSDSPVEGTVVDYEGVKALRRPMTALERQWLRELGRTLTLAIEATCRNFMPGETEADVAGHLAHRLMREGVVPLDLRVAADDRLDRYRQPTFKSAEIRRRAVISAVGRRHGLCASATRTVAFGEVAPEVRAEHDLASMVDATCIFFSRPGREVAEVFRRAARIYEKFDHADEWMLAYQGFLIGYQPRETVLLPGSSLALPTDSALCWSPSVGSARCEDTVAIDERGFEVVTEAQNWPKIEVSVKGYSIPRPGILVR